MRADPPRRRTTRAARRASRSHAPGILGPTARKKGSDTRSNAPDTKRRTPLTKRRAPDAGQRSPDAGQSAPDAGRRTPDTGHRTPDTGQRTPDAGQRSPDTGPRAPDTGRAWPSAGPNAPGATPSWLAELAADLVDAGSREHYADAALYDYEYRRRRADVTFYREIARQRLGGPGRILELGAGSGRVTIPLARDGHRVVAIDQSRPMLERLRARVDALAPAVRSRVSVVEGDLRGFRVDGTFDLAIAAFNVLEHLYTRGEVDACLRCVAQHLAPGGAFVFDVQLPDLLWLSRDPVKRWAKTRFTDPTTGQSMYYSTNHDYDPVSQIALIRLYYDPVEGGPGRVVKLSQRKFFPAELEALVAHAGLRIAARYGDFLFGPLEAGAESQVVVAEVAQPRRKR